MAQQPSHRGTPWPQKVKSVCSRRTLYLLKLGIFSRSLNFTCVPTSNVVRHITSAHSLNGSWLGLGLVLTTAPPSHPLYDYRQLEWSKEQCSIKDSITLRFDSIDFRHFKRPFNRLLSMGRSGSGCRANPTSTGCISKKEKRNFNLFFAFFIFSQQVLLPC